MECTPASGTCATCKGACSSKPGWFRPGEAERAAELLGQPLEEFFASYLAVDWWEGGASVGSAAPNVFVLSPALVDGQPGTEFPAEPDGTCVFFHAGRCQIHDAKPAECREYWCGMSRPVAHAVHRAIAASWILDQGQIHDLLGREPVAAEYAPSILDLFGYSNRGW